MKIILLSIFCFLAVNTSFGQTATNFTAKDCSGTIHDLFTELDSGKVVILCWVMPCSSCIPASQTTSNVVQSYKDTYPGKVILYLADDVANTSCTSLISWANNNHVIATETFSEAAVNMLDYGSEGMPKIVVLGGASHQVFLVADYVVDPIVLQNSVNAALITSGITGTTDACPMVNIFPNPATDHAIFSFKNEFTIPVISEIFNISGKKLETLFDGIPARNGNTFKIDLKPYQPGVYFIRFTNFERSWTTKLIVGY